MTLETIIGFLLQTPMFNKLSENELSRIVSVLHLQRVRSGQWVFREGEIGEAWYVIFEGEIEIVRTNRQLSSSIARLGPHSLFGEMAILDRFPRSASARGLTDSTLLVFPRQNFEMLLLDNDLSSYKLVYYMAQVLAGRQRDLIGRVTELLIREQATEFAEGVVRVRPISE